MRSITKILVTGAFIAPAVLSASGIATANDHGDRRGDGPAYVENAQWAGAQGAMRHLTASGFKHGKAYYVDFDQAAGAWGAGNSFTGSHS